MNPSKRNCLGLLIFCFSMPSMASAITSRLELLNEASNCTKSEVIKGEAAKLELAGNILKLQKTEPVFEKISFNKQVELVRQLQNQGYFLAYSEVIGILGICPIEFYQTYHVYGIGDDVYLYYTNRPKATGTLGFACKKILPDNGCISTLLYKLSDVMPEDIGL